MNASCKCGNTDPSRFAHYDGALGYEAIICKDCGRYSDHEKEYEPDDFSKKFIEPSSRLTSDAIQRMAKMNSRYGRY